MPVEVGACIAALEELVIRARAAADDIADEGAEQLKRLIQTFAPKLSGQLASSVAIVRVGPASRLIGPTVVYGRIREFGGRIPQHPMSHPFLKWHVGGRAVYARSVHQRGTHYVRRALATYTTEYESLAYRRWARAMLVVP